MNIIMSCFQYAGRQKQHYPLLLGLLIVSWLIVRRLVEIPVFFEERQIYCLEEILLESSLLTKRTFRMYNGCTIFYAINECNL